MEAVGLYLISEIKLAFEDKSRRRTVHGLKWKELKKETERAKARKGGWKGGPKATPPQSQIGVDRGLMRNSVNPGFASTGGKDLFDNRGESITVGYGMKYAKYFDEDRELIPDPVPKEWIEEAELMTQDWLDESIRKALGQ